MWIKRTETEMVEQQKRQRRKQWLEAIAGGLLVLLIVTFLFEWRGSSSGPFKVPVEELLSRLPWAAIAAIVSGFVIYRLDRFQAPMLVCPKCETTKHDDGANKCSCGGRFELMENMKQVNH